MNKPAYLRTGTVQVCERMQARFRELGMPEIELPRMLVLGWQDYCQITSDLVA